MSLKKRLYTAGLVSSFMLIVLAVCTLWSVRTLDPANSPVVESMTALKRSLSADMMHDAIRGDVLRFSLSRLGQGQDTTTTLKSVADDLNSHWSILESDLAALSNMDLPNTIRQSVSQGSKKAEEYIKAAHRVVGIKAGEDSSEAMLNFQASFTGLEDVLGRSSEAIHEYAKSARDEGIATAAALRRNLLGLSALFILGAAVFTWRIARSISSQLSTIIDELSQTAFGVQTTSHDFAARAEGLASGSQQQAAAIQESVAAMEEMRSMIAQTSQASHDCLVTAQRVVNRTNDGKSTMSKMVESMSSIGEANAQLEAIAAIINEITSKTAVIHDIVFKTQLLSFNASIEAARAGQHGRGFAVVAEEVGNLAELSGGAAKEIQLLLQESRSKVAEIIESNRSRVNDGVTVTQEAAELFESISSAIGQMTSHIGNINNAAKQQEIGVDQTSDSISQMSATAQANSDAAQNTADGAEDLRRQGVTLRGITERLHALLRGATGHGFARGGSYDGSHSQDSTEAEVPRRRYRSARGGANIAEQSERSNGRVSSRNGVSADDASFAPYQ